MKKIICLALAAFSLNLALAQPSSELKRLVELSVQHFPKIKEADNAIATAEARLLAAETNLPNVDLNGNYRFQMPRIEFPLGNAKLLAQPVNNVDVNVSASYALLDFGRIKSMVNRAKQDIALAQGNADLARQQLAAQVANIYYGVVYLKKALAVQDSVLAFYAQSRDLIQRRLNNGDAIRLDLLTIQSSLDQEQNRRADLQNQLNKQLNLLDYTTGVSTVAAQDFPQQSLLPDTTGFSVSKGQFIELQLAKIRLRQAEADRAVITRNHKPSLGVSATAGPRNGFLPAVNDFRFAYGAGLGLRVPLFDGQKTRRQLAINQTQIVQNQLALQSTEAQWQKDVRQTFLDLQSNAERIQNTSGQMQQALAAQLITASRLQNGVATPLDLQNAATNVQRAALSRLQFEYQYWLAQAEWERLMGSAK